MKVVFAAELEDVTMPVPFVRNIKIVIAHAS